MAEYIEGLVRALCEGNIAAKAAAAHALRDLKGSPVYCMSQCIAEDGGIPPLIELLQDGSAESKVEAAEILGYLAHYVDAHAVAIADYGGVPPLVDLLRDGSADAKDPSAERKAALVVAALLGDSVPDSVPREVKALIGAYL
ncbi:hypothetical protein JL720_5695 [Aureococcus anophagefferens]|nr:hypothetical protein JL720_5695 [Aureococcus anophagefferens]